MGLASRLIVLTKGPAPPRCDVGLSRRFYEADWQQEGAHWAAGSSSDRQPGESLDAEAGRSHWPEPQPDVEW